MPPVSYNHNVVSSKRCTKCGEEKNLSEYRRHIQARDGLQSRCTDCLRADDRARYVGPNTDYQRSYYIAHKDQILSKNSEYAKAHRLQINANMRGHHNYYKGPDRCREWRRANPERAAVAKSRRRAAMLSVEHPLTSAEWEDILWLHGNRCLYCGGTDRLAMDHVEPISLGGAHAYWNVVPACIHCNSSKGHLTLIEWKNRGSISATCL